MKYTLVLIFIAILFLVPTQAKTFEEDIANEVSAPAIFPEGFLLFLILSKTNLSILHLWSTNNC
jgi:hypothetical protein